MNNYYLAFKYKGDVNVIKVTANELANELLGHTDDIIEFLYNEEAQYKERQSFIQNMYIFDKRYMVSFDDRDPNCIMLSECEDEDNIDGSENLYAGAIVASGIPWICIRIEDSEGNAIYKLDENI